MPFYKAIKRGWDGRRIRKEGTVFWFDGPKGSWMAECDPAGNIKAGEKDLVPQRDVRAGASKSTGKSRNELRDQLRELKISFPATAGAVQLAELLRQHQEGEPVEPKAAAEGEAETTESGTKGTSDTDVI